MTKKVPQRMSDIDHARFTANARLMAFTVTSRLVEYRNRKSWSQVELATLVGVTQSTVSEWETGVVMPQLDSLMKLCIVLEIPFSFGETVD